MVGSWSGTKGWGWLAGSDFSGWSLDDYMSLGTNAGGSFVLLDFVAVLKYLLTLIVEDALQRPDFCFLCFVVHY